MNAEDFAYHFSRQLLWMRFATTAKTAIAGATIGFRPWQPLSVVRERMDELEMSGTIRAFHLWSKEGEK